MGKLAFNCLVGLKEFHMVKLVHGLKAHEFFAGLAYDRKQFTPPDNDKILLQH
jgi:hypothetical protein